MANGRQKKLEVLRQEMEILLALYEYKKFRTTDRLASREIDDLVFQSSYISKILEQTFDQAYHIRNPKALLVITPGFKLECILYLLESIKSLYSQDLKHLQYFLKRLEYFREHLRELQAPLSHYTSIEAFEIVTLQAAIDSFLKVGQIKKEKFFDNFLTEIVENIEDDLPLMAHDFIEVCELYKNIRNANTIPAITLGIVRLGEFYRRKFPELTVEKIKEKIGFLFKDISFFDKNPEIFFRYLYSILLAVKEIQALNNPYFEGMVFAIKLGLKIINVNEKERTFYHKEVDAAKSFITKLVPFMCNRLQQEKRIREAKEHDKNLKIHDEYAASLILQFTVDQQEILEILDEFYSNPERENKVVEFKKKLLSAPPSDPLGQDIFKLCKNIMEANSIEATTLSIVQLGEYLRKIKPKDISKYNFQNSISHSKNYLKFLSIINAVVTPEEENESNPFTSKWPDSIASSIKEDVKRGLDHFKNLMKMGTLEKKDEKLFHEAQEFIRKDLIPHSGTRRKLQDEIQEMRLYCRAYNDPEVKSVGQRAADDLQGYLSAYYCLSQNLPQKKKEEEYQKFCQSAVKIIAKTDRTMKEHRVKGFLAAGRKFIATLSWIPYLFFLSQYKLFGIFKASKGKWADRAHDRTVRRTKTKNILRAL